MLRARRIVKWLLALVSLVLILAGVASSRYLGFGVVAPYGLHIQCSAGGIGISYGTDQTTKSAPGGFHFWCTDPFPEPFDFLPHWRVNATWPRILGFAPRKCLMIPLWIPLVLALCGLAFIRWTERPTALPGHCPKCGYNLMANVSGQCPECGTPCRPAARQPAPQGDA